MRARAASCQIRFVLHGLTTRVGVLHDSCAISDVCFWSRFCPVDARCGIPLDSTDEKLIKSLVQATEEYIEEHSARFQRVCDVLKARCDEPLVCVPSY
jgi:hypothetical protein